MVHGVYSAQFMSNNNLVGSGIVVIDGASLHGGDLDYLYKGKYRLFDTKMSATVDVENYTGRPHSVLGPLKSFRLNLNGVTAPHGFSLSGAVDGQPGLMIRIELTKISELVDQ